MRARNWIAVGCLWAAVGVALGAFGAHAWKAALEERGQLANWDTGVRYQLVHALALIVFELWRERAGGKSFPAWCFLVGSVCFSGSIYALCFGIGKSFLWPLTPLGGVLLMCGWISFASSSIRRP